MSISTLPRPVLLGLIGVVVAAGLLFVTRRGQDTGTPATPAPPQTSQPTSPSASTPEASAQPDKSAAPTAGKEAQGGPGLPAPVARALDAKKTVVILFWNPRGVDDRSVKESVDRLSRRNGRVAKFTDTMSHLSQYTRITTAASVNTSPAVVIVNSRGQAETLSGYYDYQTLNQYVSNAVRRR